jgi:hypothetical protein
MPSGFLFPTGGQVHSMVAFGRRVDLWKPMAFTPGEIQSGGNWAYGIVARLKPGTTPAQARENLGSISAGFRFPDGRTRVRVRVVPLQEVFSGNVRQGLLMLLAAAALPPSGPFRRCWSCCSRPPGGGCGTDDGAPLRLGPGSQAIALRSDERGRRSPGAPAPNSDDGSVCF